MTKTTPPPLDMALNLYGFPHLAGRLKTKDGTAHPSPMTTRDVVRAAKEFGLTGVDIPLPPESEMSAETFRDILAENGLRFVSEYMVLVDADPDAMRDYLTRSAKAGATVVRALISNVLCGCRHELTGGWEARLDAVVARLKEILPFAHDLGVCIALENHQDATTDDLLRLAECVNHHPAFGVTLDAGNPLAVGEEPVEAARRLAPILRHIHLKDYTIHYAPEGYRLVRCAAGDGVIDFPAILEIVRNNGHQVLPGIEIAAQPTRTIPLLTEAWWTSYPPRDARDLLGALRVLWAKGRPMDEPYSSAWERGEDSATVAAEEWEVVRRSVAYFRSLDS
jgi:3-oxoisoapionate decarboxylase